MSSPSPLYPPPPQPQGSGAKTAAVIGAIVALLGANVYLYLQMNKLQAAQDHLKDSILTELTNIRESSTMTTASQRKHLEALKDDLDKTAKQSLAAAAQAKTEAMKESAKKTEQVAQQLTEEQKKAQAQLGSQIEQVATTATTKIGEVSGEVSTVKTDLSSTKSELDKTIQDLKRTNGDLGVQSGLIATNGKELAALRRLGERNYFEFNLGKSKQPQRVGDVMLKLSKADPKHNKYTVELTFDDKKVEKKDKSLNEPVQFYTSKAKQPYEIVVNAVQKDKIVGYLATPKEQAVRN